ncbi:Leucine-rich repeat extensin-like protein 4 [Datura stramonium]|uniref:Leucine-rich repeat extensin-like protein 4 n=1 Tax=Datura stramonium TaxID=4076 RepID=A0ABS8V353_DATST|nr:Leucine-rich repeat extensin-like protein 4 [Datura stramonium]
MKEKTQTPICSLYFLLFFVICLLCSVFTEHTNAEFTVSEYGPLTDSEAQYIKRRQLLYYRDEFGDRGENVKIDPSMVFENDRIKNAYIALQAWKQAIISDPFNITVNWVGPNVCNYTGIFCAPALDNPKIRTVAGIDLNHGDIAGYLPEELGLLTDLGIFHINSNRFCGTIPRKFKNLKILFELDLSNNRFAGKFPYVVLSLPKLIFLDIRFNEFEGNVPSQLFDKPLDAIFINHNRFSFELPENFGNSPVSVIVLASNRFHGCLPASIGNMTNLNEAILMNNGLRSCLPAEIGLLENLTVFDVSFNQLMGPLPENFGQLVNLEQLNVAHNMLSGTIPKSICQLPKLENFTYSYNFFTGEPPVCLRLPEFHDERNCLPNRPVQRSPAQCKAFLSKRIHCGAFRCHKFIPVLPPPPPLSPPLPAPPPPVVWVSS